MVSPGLDLDGFAFHRGVHRFLNGPVLHRHVQRAFDPKRDQDGARSTVRLCVADRQERLMDTLRHAFEMGAESDLRCLGGAAAGGRCDTQPRAVAVDSPVQGAPAGIQNRKRRRLGIRSIQFADELDGRGGKRDRRPARIVLKDADIDGGPAVGVPIEGTRVAVGIGLRQQLAEVTRAGVDTG